MTEELADLLLRKVSEIELKKEAQRQGMITMSQDGVIKALKGVTSIEEVMRVIAEK